jgi:Protein of unknown function (DUF3131)
MKSSTTFRKSSTVARLIAMLAIVAMLVLPLSVRASDGTGNGINTYSGLSASQRAVLYGIARDTWKFYAADVDPKTHLPMDNVGFNGAPARGTYTSAANIGVYLWAVVAANDLGLVSRPQARSLIQATLNEVTHLKRFDGFLYQWYDTTNGHVIKGPPDNVDCSTDTTPTFGDICLQISQVDNGWYASGLIVVRQAMPELRSLVDTLMAPMNFGIFYDNGPETQCNVYYNPANPSDPYNYQPTGQMYGVYFVGFPPSQYENRYYHNGAFYSDPRISAYIGMGLHQMPGNVWWRSWRTLPPKAPYDDCQATDPDFSWQGQWPVGGYWQDYRDPQSGQIFHVWEGHYTYPDTNLTFIPTWAGGMFEGQMANQVVPETSWGPHSFGLADLRWAQVQVKYATEQLHYPVWGLSPSSTPDDTGNYEAYGATGLAWPYSAKKGLSQCYDCNGPDMEDAVTPHASFLALDVLAQEAFANIQALRTIYPDLYGPYGFYDVVAPKAYTYYTYPNGVQTAHNVYAGEVGHRYLVLDQSMIMAALDNALNDRAMQRHFARDPVSWAAQTYLSMETMSL